VIEKFKTLKVIKVINMSTDKIKCKYGKNCTQFTSITYPINYIAPSVKRRYIDHCNSHCHDDPIVFYCRNCDQFQDIYEDLPKCKYEGCVDRADDLYNHLLERNTATGPSDYIDLLQNLRMRELIPGHNFSHHMMREINHHCITRIHDDMLLCTKCNNWMYKYIKCLDCGDFYYPRNGSHDCGMYLGIGIPPETSLEDNYYDSDDDNSHLDYWQHQRR